MGYSTDAERGEVASSFVAEVASVAELVALVAEVVALVAASFAVVADLVVEALAPVLGLEALAPWAPCVPN